MAAAGIPGWVYVRFGQDVTIEPYAGVVAGVEAYGAATTVRAVVEEDDRIQRGEAPTGDQSVMAVLRVPYATDCPSGSRVTLESGRVGTVTSSKLWGRATLAGAHLEVAIEGVAT